MKRLNKEQAIRLAVVVFGIILLLQGWNNSKHEGELAIAGAILVGSWLISRSIDKNG